MTVEEYEHMAAASVLDDPRVELINGYIVKKMEKSPPHIWAIDAIIEALAQHDLTSGAARRTPSGYPISTNPNRMSPLCGETTMITEIGFPSRKTSCSWSRSRRALLIAIRAKNAEPMRAEEYWITGSSTSLPARSRFTPTPLPAISDRSRSSSSETRSQS